MRKTFTYFFTISFLQVYCQITQLNSGTNTTLRHLSIIDENIIICGLSNNYLMKSYNEGSQLISLPSLGPYNNYNYFQRLDTSTLFLLSYGNGALLYKSTDGGNNWIKKMDTTAFAPSCFGFFDSQEGITDKGLFNTLLRTTDGGNTWTSSTSPLYSIDALKTDGDSGVCIGGLTFPGGLGILYLSKNRGHTWPYSFLIGGLGAAPTDFFFLNKDTIFGISENGVFAKTTNRGMNWNDFSTPLSSSYGIYFKNFKEGFIVGSDSQNKGVVAKTTNLGQTWQIFNTGITTTLKNISLLNDSIALLIGTGGVLLRWNYKTTIFTGINENYSDNIGLKVFPNPVKSNLRFDFSGILPKNSNVNISNTLGQIVYSINNIDLNNELEVSFLKSGIYYLKLEGKEGQKIVKIVKE